MSNKEEYLDKVTNLLFQNKRQIQISRELGISKGYVSKLVRKIPQIIRYKIKRAAPDVRI